MIDGVLCIVARLGAKHMAHFSLALTRVTSHKMIITSRPSPLRQTALCTLLQRLKNIGMLPALYLCVRVLGYTCLPLCEVDPIWCCSLFVLLLVRLPELGTILQWLLLLMLLLCVPKRGTGLAFHLHFDAPFTSAIWESLAPKLLLVATITSLSVHNFRHVRRWATENQVKIVRKRKEKGEMERTSRARPWGQDKASV